MSDNFDRLILSDSFIAKTFLFPIHVYSKNYFVQFKDNVSGKRKTPKISLLLLKWCSVIGGLE
jgi:hypothetical protein